MNYRALPSILTSIHPRTQLQNFILYYFVKNNFNFNYHLLIYNYQEINIRKSIFTSKAISQVKLRCMLSCTKWTLHVFILVTFCILFVNLYFEFIFAFSIDKIYILFSGFIIFHNLNNHCLRNTAIHKYVDKSMLTFLVFLQDTFLEAKVMIQRARRYLMNLNWKSESELLRGCLLGFVHQLSK